MKIEIHGGISPPGRTSRANCKQKVPPCAICSIIVSLRVSGDGIGEKREIATTTLVKIDKPISNVNLGQLGNEIDEAKPRRNRNSTHRRINRIPPARRSSSIRGEPPREGERSAASRRLRFD